jgi:Xaa-Pro aminopeptidase
MAFSVEPGIYLEGETGVRIEDLVHVDAPGRTLHELTRFPKEIIVLEG